MDKYKILTVVLWHLEVTNLEQTKLLCLIWFDMFKILYIYIGSLSSSPLPPSPLPPRSPLDRALPLPLTWTWTAPSPSSRRRSRPSHAPLSPSIISSTSIAATSQPEVFYIFLNLFYNINSSQEPAKCEILTDGLR